MLIPTEVHVFSDKPKAIPNEELIYFRALTLDFLESTMYKLFFQVSRSVELTIPSQ